MVPLSIFHSTYATLTNIRNIKPQHTIFIYTTTIFT